VNGGPVGRESAAIGSRHQATPKEDYKNSCDVLRVIFDCLTRRNFRSCL
jgi:hypothetical protein